MRILLSAMMCLALSASATGCVVVADHSAPAPATGSLSTYWTLSGSDDPKICSSYGVDRVDVTVYDAADRQVASAQPLCEDFGLTFDGLADDGYSLEVTLLDYDGAVMSDTIVQPVDVWAGEDTEVDVDFPPSLIH